MRSRRFDDEVDPEWRFLVCGQLDMLMKMTHNEIFRGCSQEDLMMRLTHLGISGTAVKEITGKLKTNYYPLFEELQ